MGSDDRQRPGYLGRLISRQAGRPSGALGRFIGRAMVRDTRAGNDHALELLRPEPGETVVEIGFGQGRTIERLVAAGAEVIGVEVSETMRRQAQARNRAAYRDGRVALHVGDGVRLPVRDDEADAAISAHAIYFWPEPETTLAELARVLRPGGRIVIAFRAGEADVPARLDPAVYRFYETDDVAALVDGAGFDVLSVERSPAISEYMRWITARLPGSSAPV